MYNNPIDNLLDDLDDTDVANSCAMCQTTQSYLFETSCYHSICVNCVSLNVAAKKYKTCPYCKNQLGSDLKTLLDIYTDNIKLEKLSKDFNICIGDVLWAYNGNNCNWLYSKDNCDKINLCYDNSNRSDDNSDSDDNDNSTMELDIDVGGRNETYVIDFVAKRQYQKNNYSKFRNILSFKFTDAADLKKYRIIGVAGKKI